MSRSDVSQPIRIVEVGPRDGLQNEHAVIPTPLKVSFVDALSKSGVAEIEASSFVSPKWVPQLADSEAVFRQIQREPGVTYSALVPNEKGLDRALAVGVDKIAVFTAASETFNRKNINATVRESIDRFKPVLTRAKASKLPVRAYVSTAFYCPFEGRVAETAVNDVCKMLTEIGVDEISIGDTIGRAVPRDVRTLLDVLLAWLERDRIALHYHDTYGTAVSNILTAWEEYRIFTFDSSAGGLGGCPYAPGATGNVATEDAVFALKASGAQVGVDEGRITAAATTLSNHIGRVLTSHGACRMRGRA